MKKIILTSIILTALAFSGCKREELGYGKTEQVELALSIVSDEEFTPVPDEGTKSDADLNNNNDVNEYSLAIVRTSSGETVKSWDRFADVPTVVTLEPAEYRVDAKSPGDKAVAWAQPKYAGSQTVTVVAGQTQNIAVTCGITNMMVTVKCTEAFLNEMNDDFTITVSSKDGVLVWEKNIVEAGNSGFFDVAPLKIDIKGTRKTGGSINHQASIETVAAKDHHVFTVDASETGYMDFTDGISIDYSVNGREEDIHIDGLEENPVDDEIAVPEVSAASIAEGAADVPVETASVAITYTTNVSVASDAAITLNDQPCTASASGNVVTVTFPALTAGTSYTLAVPAGAVTRAGAADAAADAFTLHFTTAAAVEEPVESNITITATAGLDEPVTYSKSEVNAQIEEGNFSFVLKVQADAGIEKFVVEVASPGLRGLIDIMVSAYPTLTYKVDLANMTSDDIAFWGNMVFPGLTSDDVKNMSEVSFEIGNFIPAMIVGETNVMNVEITDSKGKVENASLQIIMTE